MERIPQLSEAAEIIPFDISAPVLLFPVRHHSPVCSWHLLKTVQLYQPQVILIEGPRDADELIPVLAGELTQPPCAIYYYYKDKKKLVSEDAADHSCYYPFLYSSPEYNAMRAAADAGIEAHFIDLPYCEILINTQGDSGLLSKEKQNYADDGRLVREDYFKRLCGKTNVRSFEEFWEKYFEIEGLRLSTEDFYKQLVTYCTLVRSATPDAELTADGTHAREQFMAANIREAMKTHSRVLVVTGGFHTAGLAELLKAKAIPPVKLHRIPADCTGCFPAAYSYRAADSLHGYASGMSFPGFYDSVFKKLLSSGSPEGVYDDCTLTLLVKAARTAAKQDIAVSIADITAARTLMSGLAALRGIRESGMYELTDGVTSAFIKGEKTVSSSMPLDILRRLAVGDGVGKIGDSAHTPPLIADFEKQCALLRIKPDIAAPRELECALFTTAKGLPLSRLMHRMRFLETGFCERLKGPDLHHSRDRSRVREEWKYRRSPGVDASLIDLTPEGFTIEEACTNIIRRILATADRLDEAAHAAVECFLMGISIDSESDCLTRIAASDGDFFSVGRALGHFRTLLELKRLYEYEDETILPLLTRSFDKLVLMLPAMSGAPDEQSEEVCSVMRRLFALTDSLLTDRRPMFTQALEELCLRPDKHPAIFGAAMGLLCAIEPENQSEAEAAMRGYLRGSTEVKKQGAEYLKGLFSTARDIVFAENDFLRLTDELLTSMSQEDFIGILPSMRLAFSYFTPREISDTAETVAALYDTAGDDLLYQQAVDETLYGFARKLDTEITEMLRR